MRRHAKAPPAGLIFGIVRHRGAVLLGALVLAITVSLGAAGALADTAPSVTIESAPTASYTSVPLKGTVNPNGGPSLASWHFEYATAPAGEEGWSQGAGHDLSEAQSAEATPIGVEDNLTGLAPNTEYFVRLVASNEGGPVHTAEPYPSFTTKEVAVPSATSPLVTAVTDSGAHFAGTVNPNAPEAAPTSAGVEEAFRTSWHFQCSPGCPGIANPVPADEHVAAADSANPVGADVTGLTPGTEYTVRLVATNAGGESEAAGAEETFTTDPIAPTIDPLAHTSEVTKTAATLSARVNPNGADTTYRFEWGTSAAYGNSVPVPDADIGAGTADVAVSQSLAGLSPDTEYHYRVVASNLVDTSDGADHVFRTNAVASEAAGQFPGQGFLPDSRAWEMVSPVDKNGAAVSLGSGSFRASSTGGAIIFDSNVAFGDAKGSGPVGSVSYRADRDASTWETHGLTPPQDVNPFVVYNGATYDWLTPDLSHGIVRAGDPALVAGAPQGVPNLYLTDGHGESPRLLTPSVNPGFHNPANAPYTVGASSDLSKAAFESPQLLTVDAPAQPEPLCESFGIGCRRQVYEWENGTVRLASVMPNGMPAPEGAAAGPPRDDAESAFSKNGRRLYFTTLDPGYHIDSLYLRKDGSSTIWVSQSEASSPVTGADKATFLHASGDGTRAIFQTDKPLVDSDTDNLPDLYMYTDSADPTNDSNLTLLSEDHEPADGSEAIADGLLGMSDDGSRVYFATERQIVSGASNAGGPKVYMWENGVVRFLTTLQSPDFTADEPNWDLTGIRRFSRVTSDGRYLLFTTAASQPGGYDNAGHKEVYTYDADTQQISCASCNPNGAVPVTDASIGFPGAATTFQYVHYANRALADNGRVFFNTSEGLVQADSNGKTDAYQWEPEGIGGCRQTNGCVRLISSGRGGGDSYFVDASASGDDAYFVTTDRLSGWDHKDGTDLDLYDARVGGGLPGPSIPQAGCEGDACQPPPSVLNDATPGSASFLGTGNRRSTARKGSHCSRGRHKNMVKHGKRCLKKHHMRHEGQTANTDTRGAK